MLTQKKKVATKKKPLSLCINIIS